MLYFENRQNVSGRTDQELDNIFKIIADHFSHKWLKTIRGTHPLQILWNRKDALSTNELLFFGKCLETIAKNNSTWIKEQIKHIKSDNLNSRLGAFFEINGLSMLLTPDQNVQPTRGNNPGFDGILKTNENKTIRISLKNYGDSTHSKDFNYYASKFELKLKSVLKEKNISSIQIIVDASKGFPLKQNWEDLSVKLPDLLSAVKPGEPKFIPVSDFWMFMYGDLKESSEFHSDFNSYTLVVSTPFHKNEEKNLIDKLDDACYNLKKHSGDESENVINVVFIHLSELGSIRQCKEWAENYLNGLPEKPITGIILYQPTVVTDLEKDESFIHHCFQLAFNEAKLQKWNPSGINFNFQLPVGAISFEPSENKIIIDAEGKTEIFDYKNRYLFQSGNIYTKASTDGKGNMTGSIKKLATGIFLHSVAQPFPGEPAMVFSGHFPPIDKLLIL